MNNILVHHGILNQKWGIRRYQNPDGTLTEAGKKRYSKAYWKGYDEAHIRDANAGNAYGKQATGVDVKAKIIDAAKQADTDSKTSYSNMKSMFNEYSDPQIQNKYESIGGIANAFLLSNSPTIEEISSSVWGTFHDNLDSGYMNSARLYAHDTE